MQGINKWKGFIDMWQYYLIQNIRLAASKTYVEYHNTNTYTNYNDISEYLSSVIKVQIYTNGELFQNPKNLDILVGDSKTDKIRSSGL